MFVSIHIPKTAGTALGDALDRSTTRRVLFDYDPGYRNVDKPQEVIVAGIEFIKAFFVVVHGHFYYTKYAGILPSAKFITCVRNPVDRIISQYFHVAALPPGSDWRTDLICRREMNCVEFAASDTNIRDAMSVHLAGRPIEDYDYVFITEELSRSADAFSNRFSFPLHFTSGRVNTREDRRRGVKEAYDGVAEVAEEERQRLAEMTSLDTELYVRAKAKFLP